MIMWSQGIILANHHTIELVHHRCDISADLFLIILLFYNFFVEIVFIKPLYFAQKSCFFFDFEGIFSI